MRVPTPTGFEDAQGGRSRPICADSCPIPGRPLPSNWAASSVGTLLNVQLLGQAREVEHSTSRPGEARGPARLSPELLSELARKDADLGMLRAGC
jgi:hypothetical protein